jgi:hypothetical protein
MAAPDTQALRRLLFAVVEGTLALGCSSPSEPPAPPEPPPHDDCQPPGPGIIAVTTPVVRDAADGECDIVEAFRAATTRQAVNGDCPAGTGTDRIVLTAGRSYSIESTLTLAGASSLEVCGDGTAEIDAGGHWTSDALDRFGTCALHVAGDDANVRIDHVALSQNGATALTAVCLTLGSMILRHGHVTGFGRGGVLGVCDPAAGCDHDQLGQTSTLRVYNSLIENNRSPENGAGISAVGVGASLVVEHSSIVNNVSEASGGGVYYGSGWNNQRISSSTLSGNRARAGGGIAVKFAPCTATYLYVLNSTVANNTADSSGGGIEFLGDPTCAPQDLALVASIITNNVSTASDETNINGEFTGGMFTCSGASLAYVAPGRPTPIDLSPTAPCRFDVADAGLGPLLPMGGAGNLPLHPLLPGSPAIDAAVEDQSLVQQRDSWVPADDTEVPPDWTLFDPKVDGNGDGDAVRDLGAFELNLRWQTELLTVADKGNGLHEVLTTLEGYDRGASTRYAATSATNEFVTYVLPVAEAGRYGFTVGVRKAPNAGQVQWAVAESMQGPWGNAGAVVDLYSEVLTLTEIDSGATITFSSPGPKYFRCTVTGKNAASSGYDFILDYVTPRKL